MITLVERGVNRRYNTTLHVCGKNSYFPGDIIGVGYTKSTGYHLTAENMLGRPYMSGEGAAFNFAVNLYTVQSLRAMSHTPRDKLKKASDGVSNGKGFIWWPHTGE